MGPHLPALRAAHLARMLRKLGFSPIRQRGSHQFWRHPDGRTTLVPRHAGEDIGRGLLRQILREIKLSPGDLRRYLQR